MNLLDEVMIQGGAATTKSPAGDPTPLGPPLGEPNGWIPRRLDSRRRGVRRSIAGMPRQARSSRGVASRRARPMPSEDPHSVRGDRRPRPMGRVHRSRPFARCSFGIAPPAFVESSEFAPARDAPGNFAPGRGGCATGRVGQPPPAGCADHFRSAYATRLISISNRLAVSQTLRRGRKRFARRVPPRATRAPRQVTGADAAFIRRSAVASVGSPARRPRWSGPRARRPCPPSGA